MEALVNDSTEMLIILFAKRLCIVAVVYLFHTVSLQRLHKYTF
jgi:hypothetical protein